jgi:hypothetical protein
MYAVHMKSQILNIEFVKNELGFLGFLENGKIPFDIARIYFIRDVPTHATRGKHGHKKLRQILIPISGSFDVLVVNSDGQKKFHLNSPEKSLYIPEMSWREINNFSPGSCCLVVASEKYMKDDYIFDLEQFLSLVGIGG